MKTPEQFLREVIKYFPDDYVIDTPDEGISIHSIIKAMEEYAIQSVECAKDSIEKIEEDLRNEYEGKLTDAQQADWSEIAALKYDIFQVKGEYETIKRVNESLEKSVKIWEISHSEQRKKIVKFLQHIENYPVQYTPGLRAEIENMINYFSK